MGEGGAQARKKRKYDEKYSRSIQCYTIRQINDQSPRRVYTDAYNTSSHRLTSEPANGSTFCHRGLSIVAILFSLAWCG